MYENISPVVTCLLKGPVKRTVTNQPLFATIFLARVRQYYTCKTTIRIQNQAFRKVNLFSTNPFQPIPSALGHTGSLRPIYMVSGTRENPPPRVTLGELTFKMLKDSTDRL